MQSNFVQNNSKRPKETDKIDKKDNIYNKLWNTINYSIKRYFYINSDRPS